MPRKMKKKPSSEAAPAPVPAPSKLPLPPHLREVVKQFKSHVETAPPGISFRENESGIGSIDLPSDPLSLVHLMGATGIMDMGLFQRFVVQIANAEDNRNGTDARPANAALAFVADIKPRDAVEACLASQMAMTHAAAMAFAGRLNAVETLPQQDSAINGFNKLTRSYCAQMEALKKYRSSSEQKITVQHINVTDNAQAIVGNVTTGQGQGGGESKKEDTTS
jgi:hypothetical protein